jgi:hypothetical protein
MSALPTAGKSLVTSTKIRVGDSSWSPSWGAVWFGRKSAALVGSTLTPVISTPLEKINWNPTNGSEQGSVVEQKGSAAWLVITILVSPTEIVDSLTELKAKSTGTVGSGKFVPPGRKFGTSQGSLVVQGPGGGEVVVRPLPGIQKEASTVLPSSPARAGALAIPKNAAATATKKPNRIFPLPRALLARPLPTHHNFQITL